MYIDLDIVIVRQYLKWISVQSTTKHALHVSPSSIVNLVAVKYSNWQLWQIN